MDVKRITLFMGHYGSGKTFSAVNFSYLLKDMGKKVSIYDLDIVNPYFRTVDAKSELDRRGINLVVSPYAETNVDIPAMNAASYRMLDNREEYAVVDVGGDDRGALALGRFSQGIKKENNYDAVFVVNCFRPETQSIEDAINMMREIELTSKIPFTCIVNNANLGNETTVNDIIKGLDFCKKLGSKTGLDVKFTSVREDLITKETESKIDKILRVKPIEYKIW